jgi:hypothetical protein
MREKNCHKLNLLLLIEGSKFSFLPGPHNCKSGPENSIHDEIKSGLILGNACYRSVQNILFSLLLSKNVNTKVCKTVILPVAFYMGMNLVL